MVFCGITSPAMGRLLLIASVVFVPALSPLSIAAAEGERVTLQQIEQCLQNKLPSMEKTLVGLDFGDAAFGSGIIVSKDGLILTAAHVTGGVRRPLTVILPGGKRVKAVTKGLNAARDTAMAQITEPGEYAYAELAKSPPRQGDWVFSLGHSGGYDKARGPVVRLGKVLFSDDEKIQTDCKLIGGDSGGPLFNKEGQLIGIHSRVGQSLEDNVHVTLAVFTKEWAPLSSFQWIENGPFVPRELGFLNWDVLETPEGMKITAMPLKHYPSQSTNEKKDQATELPAEGDFIVRWNEAEIKTLHDLDKCRINCYPGQKVQLTIKKGQQEIKTTFFLGNKSKLTPEPTDKKINRL